MPQSPLFTRLSTRISDIETHLFPNLVSASSPTYKETDFIRAYCLLCHAEFEEYIEKRLDEVLDSAFNTWKADKERISPIIFHLAIFAKPKSTPYTRVGTAYSELKKKIKDNNGIKEDNLINLFDIIGFSLEPILLTTLTGFGVTRGEIAHSSYHTQTALDASTQKNTVNLILSGLQDFDTEIEDYEKRNNLKRNRIKALSKLNWKERLAILFRGQPRM